jgi:hypothetical protein
MARNFLRAEMQATQLHGASCSFVPLEVISINIGFFVRASFPTQKLRRTSFVIFVHVQPLDSSKISWLETICFA